MNMHFALLLLPRSKKPKLLEAAAAGGSWNPKKGTSGID
jgi:hypothetical protein